MGAHSNCPIFRAHAEQTSYSPPPAVAVAFAGTERFVVVRELGAGGMGAVYEVYDRERNERVALKTLLRVDPLGIHRFKREFRALADVAHPNLVSLYELHADLERWFFTMELLEGVSFTSYVRRPLVLSGETRELSTGSAPTISGLVTQAASEPSTPSVDAALTQSRAGPAFAVANSALQSASSPQQGDGSPLDETRLRNTLWQLASGLYALHDAGRLHRDIKPSNVFVTHSGRVVLLDFGLVLERGDEASRSRPQLAGTPEYMSPEQFSQQRLTPASDWYAVGLMLYEALTGRLPFVSQHNQMGLAFARVSMEPLPPREVTPTVPADLNYLCVDLLRVQPDKRPTGPEILRRLRAAAEPASLVALRASSGVSTPSAQLMGRERELATLHALYAQTFAESRTSATSIVIVHGISGMGKSALVQHFLTELRRSNEPVILQGRCYEQESVPYKALDTSIEALVAYLLGLSEPALTHLLPHDGWALERVFPAFRRVDALAKLAAQPRLSPEPRELRKTAFAALRELLSRMSRSVHVVLHIDDLQWGDVESADLLEQVLRAPDAPPILLLLSCRTEELKRSPFMRALFGEGKARPAWNVHQLEVGPLSNLAAEQLGFALSPQLDPSLAAAAARESGGSPLFMNELVRYVTRTEGQDFSHQVTIEQLLLYRFEQLSRSARRLLEVISVASQPIRETVAGEASQASDELRDGLRELRLAHLIRSAGADDTPLVETFHDRIRETMLGLLTPERTRAHHLRLAVTLEGSHAGDGEMLAVHFAAAGEREKASHYAAQAGAQAAAALAFDRAARLYALALDTSSVSSVARHQLELARADALTCAGRAREAADVYLAAASRVDRARAVPLQSRAAGQLLLSGHIDEGFATLDHVLSALELKLPSSRRRTLLAVLALRGKLWLRGLSFQRCSEEELSSDVLLRIDTCWQIGLYLSSVDPLRGAYFQLHNLLLALAAGEPFRIARSLSVEAAYASVAGKELSRARKLLAASDALAQELNHPYLRGLVALAEGVVAFMGEENWARAGDACQRSERIFREHGRGVPWELTNSQFFKLNSYLLRGQLRQVAHQLPEALESAQNNGNLFSESFLSMRFQLMVRLAHDDPAQMRSDLALFATRLSSTEFYVQHYWRQAAEVAVDLYTGQQQAAWNRIKELWENLERSLILRMMFHRIDAFHLRGRAALAMAAAQTQRSRRAHYLKLVQADIARLKAENTRRARPLAKALRAGALWQQGDRQRGLVLLERAALGFEEAEMLLHANSARWWCGQHLADARGVAMRERAERFMREQGVQAPSRMASLLIPGFDGA